MQRVTVDQPEIESGRAQPDERREAGLLDSLIRLGLGGVFVGARAVRWPSTLQGELAPRDPADVDASPAIAADEGKFDSALNVAVGAAAVGRQVVARGVGAAVSVNRRAWNATAPLRRPLDWIGVNDLVGSATQSALERVDRMEQVGRVEILESRQQALGTLTVVIDAVVAYLAQSPAVSALIGDKVRELLPELAHDEAIQRLVEVQVDALLPQLAESEAIQSLIQAQVDALLPKLADSAAIQNLIRTQAGAYLFYLQSHPEQIEALIRKQGNTYIDYLNENPEKVRNLVSGQGVGLAAEMLDQVRERTVTADSVAEMVVRGLLRKKPRADVEQPAEAVQRRANVAVLPSDFVRPQETDNGR